MARKSKSELAALRQLLGPHTNLHGVRTDIANLTEEALRTEMREIRRLNRKRLGGRSPNPKQRAIAKRVAANKARAVRNKFGIRKGWSISVRHLVRQRHESPILDRLDPSRPKKWRPIVARKFEKELPRIALQTLNFLDSPIDTLSDLQKLSSAEQSLFGAHLDFSDARCHDVGAYLVLAEIWPQMAQVFRGGRMSLPVQKVLSAIELDSQLGIGLPGVRDHADVWAFPIRHRRPKGTTQDINAQLKPQDREKVADELCDLFNEWLEVSHIENDSSIAWELSDDGKALIANMSGELLCNAERHSVANSHDGDWSMTAFMAAREDDEGNRQLRCYLAFLSVGQSIAESMAHAPTEILDASERYIKQFGSKGPSKDTLMTVLALQDSITSNETARNAGRGGTGLQDVFDFIGDLGAGRAPQADIRATIVSGASCIRLRSPYLVGARDARGKRVQWCNPWNDPKRPPDRHTAFDLPAHFAGTLVSVGFTLDSRLFVSEENLDDAPGD